jgi:MYXO-CTERM domain-containing protein
MGGQGCVTVPAQPGGCSVVAPVAGAAPLWIAAWLVLALAFRRARR